VTLGAELEALLRRIVREELAAERGDAAPTDDDADLRRLAAEKAARMRGARRRDG
jgi:hypothetical protein